MTFKGYEAFERLTRGVQVEHHYYAMFDPRYLHGTPPPPPHEWLLAIRAAGVDHTQEVVLICRRGGVLGYYYTAEGYNANLPPFTAGLDSLKKKVEAAENKKSKSILYWWSDEILERIKELTEEEEAKKETQEG